MPNTTGKVAELPSLEFDMFSLPEPMAAPAPVHAPVTAMETRGSTEMPERICCTCGGKGSYKVKLKEYDRFGKYIRDVWATKTCEDCSGARERSVPVKADCPESVVTGGYSYAPGAMISMTKFSREMAKQGYGHKVTTAGDLDPRKVRQCCNALLRGPASDKPEPTVADWEEAIKELPLSGVNGMPSMFQHVADDPDPDARHRIVSRITAAEEAEKAARDAAKREARAKK